MEYWKRITSDKHIIDILKQGFKIEFLSEAPHSEPFRVTCSTKENGIITQEMGKLSKMKVMVLKLLKREIFSPQYFYELKNRELWDDFKSEKAKKIY